VLVEASTSTGRPPRKSSETRFHIVKPGESLWSIAKRLLGPTATPAEIAREVNRLWELNKDRIGTGNPDLLIAGAKLRLR
jgi:nucleoid-associated protein YgaU